MHRPVRVSLERASTPCRVDARPPSLPLRRLRLRLPTRLNALPPPFPPWPHPGAPFNEKQQQAVHASAGVQAGAQPPAAPAGLPATPFDQRRGPVIDTRGLPATTPLAAEILASLNGNVLAASGTGASAAATIDAADGAAAATLSGLLQGSGSQPERQPEASAPLPSLLGNAQLASLPQAAAVAALAAAAAAGPALPVPRRQAAPPGGLLLPLSVQLGRQQRPCNCKRSMCLKMYCECFAAGEAGLVAGTAQRTRNCHQLCRLRFVPRSQIPSPTAHPAPTPRRRLLRHLLLLPQLLQHARRRGRGAGGARGGAGQEPARL